MLCIIIQPTSLAAAMCDGLPSASYLMPVIIHHHNSVSKAAVTIWRFQRRDVHRPCLNQLREFLQLVGPWPVYTIRKRTADLRNSLS